MSGLAKLALGGIGAVFAVGMISGGDVEESNISNTAQQAAVIDAATEDEGSVEVQGFVADESEVVEDSTPAAPVSMQEVKIIQEKPQAPVTQEKKAAQDMPRAQNCHSSYSGCLNPNASDYDCAGGSGNGPYYTGKVRVTGPDVFGLDRDNDGWGCE